MTEEILRKLEEEKLTPPIYGKSRLIEFWNRALEEIQKEIYANL